MDLVIFIFPVEEKVMLTGFDSANQDWETLVKVKVFVVRGKVPNAWPLT